MIQAIRLLRNVGQFDSVSSGATLPFARVTLIYAENGRGKTTLAAILRSLATGNPIALAERRRLTAQHDPHVIVECSGGAQAAMFQNGAWNRTLTDMVVFDDAFVDANLFSGLAVDPEHRQNLHEFILGAQGVELHRQLDQLVARVEGHNTALREKGAAIPATERGNFSVDAFCDLPSQAGVEAAIQEVERRIASVREQDPIRQASPFDALSLPALDLTAIGTLLARDLPSLDAAAATKVQAHVAQLGRGSESWIADGLDRLTRAPGMCPFCAQDVAGSDMIGHYRAYFSAEYAALKSAVATMLAGVGRTHGADAPAAFERAVRVAVERRQFWSQFCEVPEVVLDTGAIARDWKAARDAVSEQLAAKQAAPLDRMAVAPQTTAAVATYEAHRARVEQLSGRLHGANRNIELVKEQAAAGNSAALEQDRGRLRATKFRHTPTTSALCDQYLAEKQAKAQTVRQRDQAKAALDLYRTNVFPRYQEAVNGYLGRFNAGFRLAGITSVTSRGGAACNYSVLINNTPVPVAGGAENPGQPSFRNTLSAGDRNTLALAFFFASLDQDPAALSSKTVVVDDPLTSLDEHRSLRTVQELRQLATRTAQVIVLSHSKQFLGRIWKDVDASHRAAIQLVRDGGVGSTLQPWDVDRDATTEHDRRHEMLRQYDASGSAAPNSSRDVAEAIRHVLEGFLRVACPAHFPAGQLLGPFRGLCEQRVGTPDEILNRTDFETLGNVVEYANKFHHNTNPAWETESINENELHGYVRTTLSFVKRR